MSKQGRFSKTAMLNHIDDRMKRLERENGFHHGQGWAVVNGKSHETIIAFGQYDALRDLMSDIEDGCVA